MASQPQLQPMERTNQRRLVVAGLSTSTIEFYDFMLYGTMAALVFNQVFFPAYSPTTGTLAPSLPLPWASWLGRSEASCWADWATASAANGQ